MENLDKTEFSVKQEILENTKLKHLNNLDTSEPKIRMAELGDSFAIHEAHSRSICELCSKDYSEAMINAWGRREYSEEIRHKNILENTVYVIEYKNKIEGFCHITEISEKSLIYIDAIYFTPEIVNKGLAKKLFIAIEEEANDKNYNSLSLHSTITSLGFYKKIGFELIGEKTFYMSQNIQILCYEMVKKL